MRCLTATLKAHGLTCAKEAYVRKFGEEPPEYPEGSE